MASLTAIQGVSREQISPVQLEQARVKKFKTNPRKDLFLSSHRRPDPSPAEQLDPIPCDAWVLFASSLCCLMDLFFSLHLPKSPGLVLNNHSFYVHRIYDRPVYLSTLTLMKNEADYLLEWIDYRLLVGIERFFW
jgi:hypothetical protein